MENNSKVLIYQTTEGQTQIEVQLENETVWLNQEQMVELFQRDKSGILRQIKNTFEEDELNKEAVVAKFAAVQKEGNRTISRGIDHYNLDVIISVGYRVKSHRGTPFRIWATERLREYII